MRARRLGRFLAGCAILIGGLIRPAMAEEDPLRRAKVTYVAGASIYVDAGSTTGLAVGDVLEVLHDGEVIATLTVEAVSSSRALCRLTSGDTSVLVGDLVQFRPASGPALTEEPPAPKPVRRTPAKRRDTGFHGRIGVRYLSIQDLQDGGGSFTQPGLDLRLYGGGPSVGADIDVRSHRTYRADVVEEESQDVHRVYRAAVRFHPEGLPLRVTLGRQASPALAAVNIFDGAEVALDRPRWILGAFSGTQPDPVDFGYSDTVREHGGYVGWRSLAGGSRFWALTTGLVGSYEESEISREFSYVQANYRGPRISAYLIEEVDLNRGWKQEAEGSSVSLTSSFVSAQWRVSRVLTFNGGYDSRRNVRLYRDRVTPETEFDDAYREGAWVGTTLRFGDHVSLGADVRSRSGEAGDARTYTFRTGLMRLTPLMFDLRSRSSRYLNEDLEGWIHSLSLGVPAGHRVHIELTGGLRNEVNLLIQDEETQLAWYGLDLDINLGRRWYYLLSGERSRGDRESTQQIFTSLSLRF